MADMREGVDLPAHQRTFSGFTQLMTWGTVVAVLAAALVVFLIAN